MWQSEQQLVQPLGQLLAILLAPKSGKENREDIMNAAREIRKRQKKSLKKLKKK